MKRYVWSIIVLAFVANASDFVVSERSKDSKTNLQKTNVKKLDVKKLGGKISQDLKFELIKIKENNTTKNMLVPIESVDLTGVSRQSSVDTKLNSKDGLIIVFIDKNTDIEAFQISFNVKLKEKLQIGYYIFENNSEFSDVVLMNTILKSKQNQNVETIKPNWKMQMKKY